MRYSKLIFKNSLSNLFQQKMIYYLMALMILGCVFANVIIPLAMSNLNLNRYYATDWYIITLIFYYVLLMFTCCLIGETNTAYTKEIYILSKPISRNRYLFSKCLSSLAASLTMIGIQIIALIIVYLSELIAYNEHMFKHSEGCNPLALFLGLFAIWFFATTFGTIYRNFLKNIISTVILTVVILLYAIIYPLTVDLAHANFSSVKVLLWVSLPNLFWLFSLIFGGLGVWLFSKKEIAS